MRSKSSVLKKDLAPFAEAQRCDSFLEAGVSLRWLQDFLGHSTLMTTLVYLHLTDDGEADGRKALDDLTDSRSLFHNMDSPQGPEKPR